MNSTVLWRSSSVIRALYVNRKVTQNVFSGSLRQEGRKEGCVAGIATLAIIVTSILKSLLIFLNHVTEACVKNCKARHWEPHKYQSRETQDANLRILIELLREYETRDDEFSLRAHRELFDTHIGRKVEYRSNEEASRRVKCKRVVAAPITTVCNPTTNSVTFIREIIVSIRLCARRAMP